MRAPPGPASARGSVVRGQQRARRPALPLQAISPRRHREAGAPPLLELEESARDCSPRIAAKSRGTLCRGSRHRTLCTSCGNCTRSPLRTMLTRSLIEMGGCRASRMATAPTSGRSEVTQMRAAAWYRRPRSRAGDVARSSTPSTLCYPNTAEALPRHTLIRVVLVRRRARYASVTDGGSGHGSCASTGPADLPLSPFQMSSAAPRG